MKRIPCHQPGRTTVAAGCLALAVLTACGDSDETPPPGQDMADRTGDGDAGDGTTPQSWQPLIEGSWTIPPGQEKYYCVRKTVTQDTYITAFNALSPVGTHHTVLSVGEPNGPDGMTECNSLQNHKVLIYASGVGATPLEMPDRVAVKVAAGQQLLINLHLFNTSDLPLSGTSGTQVRLADPATPDLQYAEAVLMGPINLDIQPGPQVQKGGCLAKNDAQIFAVAPHMHTLGTHMKVTAHSAQAGPVVLLDAPYDFEVQTVHRLAAPVAVKQGERIAVDCSYDNTTGKPVKWGESTNDEMCFAITFQYPAQGHSLACTDG